MKTAIFFLILIVGFFIAIASAVRPDLVQKHYTETTAPVTEKIDSIKAAMLQKEKTKASQAWRSKLNLPATCRSATTALKTLECKNIMDEHMMRFERHWKKNHTQQ
jgi:hypothetical protein